MDEFKRIQKKTYFGKQPVVGDDAHWLVQEVFRLRKIEDIARSVDHCFAEFGDDAPGACGEYFQIMGDVLDANPRPESAAP